MKYLKKFENKEIDFDSWDEEEFEDDEILSYENIKIGDVVECKNDCFGVIFTDNRLKKTNYFLKKGDINTVIGKYIKYIWFRNLNGGVTNPPFGGYEFKNFKKIS